MITNPQLQALHMMKMTEKHKLEAARARLEKIEAQIKSIESQNGSNHEPEIVSPTKEAILRELSRSSSGLTLEQLQPRMPESIWTTRWVLNELVKSNEISRKKAGSSRKRGPKPYLYCLKTNETLEIGETNPGARRSKLEEFFRSDPGPHSYQELLSELVPSVLDPAGLRSFLFTQSKPNGFLKSNLIGANFLPDTTFQYEGDENGD